jgi:hypothetical protein
MTTNKTRLFFSIYTILFLLLISLSSFLIVSCDYEPTEGGTGNYQRFDWDLHGTWTTNESASRYTGTLIIDYNQITITGYGETQTPTPGGNDTERPFRNFTKGIALEGYTEEVEETREKIILIKDAGKWLEGIPYTYWEGNSSGERIKLLRFTFGGRQETLRKQ